MFNYNTFNNLLSRAKDNKDHELLIYIESCLSDFIRCKIFYELKPFEIALAKAKLNTNDYKKFEENQDIIETNIYNLCIKEIESINKKCKEYNIDFLYDEEIHERTNIFNFVSSIIDKLFELRNK